ncbi:DUF2514 domain-containing protein [Pseudomonas serbica]
MNGLAARFLAFAMLEITLGYGAYKFGRTLTDAEWQARWAEQGEFQARARTAAELSARIEEQRRQAAINQVGRDARVQNQVAAIDATGANAAGERLHVAVAKLAIGVGGCTADTDAARRSQTATRAAMVLSNLFQRADDRAGELAKAYDAARIAGQACEVAFDRLTKSRS